MAKKKAPLSRSAQMARIKSKNTKPEKQIRQWLRELGFLGYRLHRKDIPGSPDIAFVGRKKTIFVHGCFWHQHYCRKGRMPQSNKEFWEKKFLRNKTRDEVNSTALKELGWHSLVVWECELKNAEALKSKLNSFLQGEVN